jgi:hydrogenase-4 component F
VAKSLLFFGAGNVRPNLGTLRIDEIQGISRTMPQTTAALLVGGLAIVGLPPFSLFISEFAILSEAFAQARYLVAILFLIVLSVVFGGFAFHFFRMLGGVPDRRHENSKLIPSEFIAMGIAALCVLFFGVRIPHAFGLLLQEAMAVLR